MESYKNVLANRFMKDTNYIIIKDTDDLEELDRQWELFNTQLTVRQQRLSDDRSIEIWNMTNQQHYESLRNELMDSIDSDENEDYKRLQSISYDTDDDMEDDEVNDLLNASLDDFEIPDDENDITEPVKEESTIPLTGDIKVPNPKVTLGLNRDYDKDNQADQYEIDSNINIIGSIKGDDIETYLSNLDKSFSDFNSQSVEHRRKSDDKCREIYGMSNADRYNKLKADALYLKKMEKTEIIKPSDEKGDTLTLTKTETLGEFVSEVYKNMQVINETESSKAQQHRRLNDTPYFTPSELIDMGVHGNHNYYCKDADNDGLITNIKIATWFDSYRDMCLDHIFEDYRKDWIDTLDYLYSDFETIKESGNEDKILARKQSILDLGWNPEIPFNRKNRLKASERVSKILDETIPKDIFINLDSIEDIMEDDELMQEGAKKSTHTPVFLIFTQGKTPIISQGIKFVTGSNYSHASISFDPELNEVYSYNMRGENFGFVRENLNSFKDNVISVMTFFAPNKIADKLKAKINDFENNKTTFDLRIFLNKILHIDRKVSKNEYRQVCSTFVDTVLKSGDINITDNINIPDPGQLYNHAKSMSNKIIEVYDGVATEYDGKKVKRKITFLFKKGNTPAINESVQYITEEQSPRREVAMTKNLIDFYKDSTNDWDIGLKHLRWSNNVKGIMILSDDWGPIKDEDRKLLGYVAVKKQKESNMIIGLEVSPHYFQRGTGSYLLYLAENELGATLLSVNKSNTKAIDMYKNNGWSEYKTSDSMIFMQKIIQESTKDSILNEASFINDKGESVPKICPLCKSEVGIFLKGEPVYCCTNKKCNKFFGVVPCRKSKKKSVTNESVLNEVKQFPVEFDKEGNLIIYKARIGSLSFSDEISDSVQLLEAYRNASNIEGIKYELAKIWYINDCIEKKLKKRLTNDKYKELIDMRATCLNIFKLNLEFVMKAEKGFNFSDYYNSTPFSDNSIKITANTIKYAAKTITNMI